MFLQYFAIDFMFCSSYSFWVGAAVLILLNFLVGFGTNNHNIILEYLLEINVGATTPFGSIPISSVDSKKYCFVSHNI